MGKKETGKLLFTVLVAAMIVSVGALSYYYLGGGQEAFSGSTDDGIVPEDNEQPTTQELAPDFSYPAVGGGSVSLSGLRGKVVILDFMATWCEPCRNQIENLVQIRGEYDPNEVVIISIDVDVQDTSSRLLNYKNELGATWQFVLDTDGIGMNPKYYATSIPTMVFIGKDGAIAKRDVGLMSVGELRNAINPLL